MAQRIKKYWQSFSISKKIATFTGLVFLIISLSVLFDLWVVRFSLMDFNVILDDNSRCSNLVQVLEEEKELFSAYVKSPTEEEEQLLEAAMEQTYEAVYELPFQYQKIGEERYAKTWSIRNSYELYCEKRNRFLTSEEEESQDYVNQLYELYDMQDYLKEYAALLMTYTMEDGNKVYQKKVPWLFSVPIAVVVAGCVLFLGMIELSNVMYKTMISPIIALVNTSKKIAANDFFVEDVKVENQDEMGELVRAFNKMKYATGEYILALEEKRKTLDLLHEEELEKLETEKRLETMRFELLKNQMNPHFLFNTLNVIGGMANLEEAHTTEKMMNALSSLLRYNLRTTEMVVPLAQELKVVEDYMYLQQMRFGERLSYEIDCRVDAAVTIVPVFILQPLVENAIIHGLGKKEDGGKIRVLVRKKENSLYIYVADTGIGMEPEKLERLRSEIDGEETFHCGIGLGNVSRRVGAIYADSAVEIYSKPQAGTVIKIVITEEEGL